MHTFEQVLQIINQQVAARSTLTRRMSVAEAYGQRLAEAVSATGDSPAFDRAILDGFAVRSIDAHGGAALRIIGRQEAGKAVFDGVLGIGECVAINTGGTLPQGADAVLMVEQSAPATPPNPTGEFIRALQTVPPGYGIQRCGSDAKKGQLILPAGIRLNAAALAAAVAAGAADLGVVSPIRVAVLTTGDELVPPGATPTGGQIRNSNHPMLCALVREALGVRGELLDLGSCADVVVDLRRRLEHGLEAADVVLVSGGMSMGSKDLVPPVLIDLGVAFHVEKVRIKPGKPFVFGTRGQGLERRYVAGLPGNPVSAFVTFQVFVAEILARLAGEGGAERWAPARARIAFPGNPGDREFFQPCKLTARGGECLVKPLAWRGSGDVFTLALAQGLVRRPAGAPALEIGGIAPVLRF